MSVENCIYWILNSMFCRGKDASDVCYMAPKFSLVSDQALEILSPPEGRLGISRSDRGHLTSRNEEENSSQTPEFLPVICVAEHTVLHNYTKIHKIR